MAESKIRINRYAYLRIMDVTLYGIYLWCTLLLLFFHGMCRVPLFRHGFNGIFFVNVDKMFLELSEKHRYICDMKRNEVYKTPKEIHELLGISPANLKKHRLAGYLKKVKWSVGTTDKSGKPYYELNEVKKIFYK